MANEISFANLETNHALAHMLAGMILATLYDPTDLRAVCTRIPFTPRGGSETTKVGQYSRAHAFAAATSEILGGAANTAIGDASFQLVVARRVLKFSVTDLWRMVAPMGSLDLDLLAGVFVEATGMTITDMLCALFSGLTANTAVGATNQDMSVEFMDDAMFALNLARAPAPYAMVLRPKAYNEWFASLSTLGGARQYKQETQGLLSAGGPGFKGTIGNIQVWDSDSVNTDGGTTYYENAMFGAGCFAFQEAPALDQQDVLPPNVFRIDAGPVLIVYDYSAANALTDVYGNYYPAVSEAEDARGVEVRSQIA